MNCQRDRGSEQQIGKKEEKQKKSKEPTQQNGKKVTKRKGMVRRKASRGGSAFRLAQLKRNLVVKKTGGGRCKKRLPALGMLTRTWSLPKKRGGGEKVWNPAIGIYCGFIDLQILKIFSRG